MYKLKQIPEDFIVNEISNFEVKGKGNYSYYILRKKNYSTLRAAEHIAEKIGIPLKWIGFAGNKDKAAITSQLISIKNKKADGISLKDIELNYLGSGDEPISLGDLEGNRFEITIRNLDDSDTEKLKTLSGKIKFKNTVHRTVIGQGNALHPSAFRLSNKIFNTRHAVKKRIFTMDMKMSKRHKNFVY